MLKNQIMIIKSNESVVCSDCGDEVTPEEMKLDQIRMHKTKEGIFCECCYEDYLERRECN